MKEQNSVELLRQAWIDFLQQKGHKVNVPEGCGSVVTSHSPEHNSFRWLLFAAEGRIKKLNLSQTRQLAEEVKLAKKQRQKPYVVVRFIVPEPKVIIKPADKVLETGGIDSAIGGIPWFE